MSVTWRRCFVCIDEIGRFLREHLLRRRNSNQLAARGWATCINWHNQYFISHFWGQGSEKILTWNCSTNITHCSPPECLCGKISFFSKINKWGKRKSPHHPCRYFFYIFLFNLNIVDFRMGPHSPTPHDFKSLSIQAGHGRTFNSRNESQVTFHHFPFIKAELAV